MSNASNLCKVIYDPIYMNHRTGSDHPERSQRLIPILEQVTQLDLIIEQPQTVNKQWVLLCHSPAYLSYIEELTHRMKGTLQLVESKTGDVVIGAESLDVALHATAGAVHAVDIVCKSNTKRAFSLARPPGHHASFDQGKGFCIFNHAAIAARYAQNTYAMRNILILDWDVHHGDGTQNIFYHDPSIFYFSTHQINHYPFSGFAHEKGADKEVRNIWNFPIYPTDQSREEVLSYFENTLPEIAKWIKPDLVIISCGFDGHEMDPLGGFNLTDQDFERLTKAAITVAEKYSSGRVVSILEGGYQLDALASASYQHLKALNEWKPYPES